MRVSGIPYVQGRNAYSDPDGSKFGIAIHATANTASAENEAAYAQRRTDGVSSHFYADHDSVIQSLDTNSRAGHAGSSTGNNNAIAVEVTGLNSWTRQQWLDRVAWSKLGAVLAEVCRAYGIAVRRASVSEMKANPRVKAFYGHNDMRLAWAGTDHTDPGPNFPWERLLSAVNAALDPQQLEDPDVELTDNISVGLYENAAPGVTLPSPLPQTETVSVGVALGSAHRRAYLALYTAEQVLDEVRELRANPPTVVQPSDQQWNDLKLAVLENVNNILAAKLGEVVEQALSGPAGQAALVRAVNTAEDS